jgi:hypothetical protein
MRPHDLFRCLCAAMAGALVVLAVDTAQSQETERRTPTTVIRHAPTAPHARLIHRTAKPVPMKWTPPPVIQALVVKGIPAIKGEPGACVTLVRDTSGLYQYAYFRGKNGCARRVRLWVFRPDDRKWYDSIILEPREDATSEVADGIGVTTGEVVAACYMDGDTTPPGCFSKIAGGVYPIASNNIDMR